MEEFDVDSNSTVASSSISEIVGWILVLFAFIVGIMGENAIVGVIMASLGALIGLIKKNWTLFVIGLIDAIILISYMNDISEFNSILNPPF